MKLSHILLLSVFMVLLVWGCKPDPTIPPLRPQGKFILVHASPLSPSLSVTAQYLGTQNTLVDTLEYTERYPKQTYLKLEQTEVPKANGYTDFKLYFKGRRANKAVEDSMTLSLNSSQQKSIWLADTNGTIIRLELSDNYTKPQDSSISVRFFNISARQGLRLTLTSELESEPVDFGQATEFYSIPQSGFYSLRVVNADNQAVYFIRRFWLAGGAVYTWYYDGNILLPLVHE